MRGAAHSLAGLGTAATVVVLWPESSVHSPLIPAVSVFVGACAPDRLEWGIPHRTLTHWTLGWAVLALSAWFVLGVTSLALLIMFFALGALVHISGDALTPMGVPILRPFERISFVRTRVFLAEPLWISVFFLTPGLALVV